ncbi:multicopper oxidase domain-containing protein [Oryzihumus sp.]|uniref:multicopper oxidase domain-containing protein n=1 Tax=Oryzihumus sp. TaxID=1968903 RepID=UPI002ED85FDE
MRMLLLAGCVLVWVASVLWAVRTGPERSRRAARWVALGATGTLVSALGLGLATGSAEAGTGHTGHAAAAAPAKGAMTGDGYWQQVGGAPFHPTGRVRTYYVGADEVEWNYAPTGSNQVTDKDFDDVADVFVKRGPARIGSTYLKCLYRQYTDATFTHRSAPTSDDAYLGFTGPVIRAEVGDTVKVVFRNGCSVGASVHPHGVFYQKASEGAPYADNTSGQDTLDDAVPRGGRHTYTWLVPDRAGPGPHDGSSVMWMYHSHTDEVADTYAGLQGFMVITAKGMGRADGSPKDVDREVFELFSVMNEGGSSYLAENIKRYAQPAPAPDDEGFEESNLMHSVNGYVYGNQPLLTLQKGERVRWYVMSMGTEVDLHTPHWHGNDVLVGGMRMDVVNLLPASMIVADMVPDNAGTWLFHCHVNDHISAGMMTRYRVVT